MPAAWGHGLAKRVASRTPDQFAAGWGARKRRSPTGGAANGMPRNERESVPTAPLTSPLVVRTTDRSLAATGAAEAMATRQVVTTSARHRIGQADRANRTDRADNRRRPCTVTPPLHGDTADAI